MNEDRKPLQHGGKVPDARTAFEQRLAHYGVTASGGSEIVPSGSPVSFGRRNQAPQSAPRPGIPGGATGVPTLDIPPELQGNPSSNSTTHRVGLRKRVETPPVPDQESRMNTNNYAAPDASPANPAPQTGEHVEFNPLSNPHLPDASGVNLGKPSGEHQSSFGSEMPTETPPRNIDPATGRRSALINLPSRGLYYNPNRIPVSNGAIRAYLFTGREELAFAGATGDYLRVIDAILANCFNSDLIPREMIVGDRLYALMALRANTYGGEYNYPVKCVACNTDFTNTVDLLNDLTIAYADPEWGPEPFSVELPISKDTVCWRMMRGFDEVKVDEYVANYFEANTERDPLANPNEECRNALLITSINGEETVSMQSFRKKIEWLRQLDGLDMAVLRTEMNEREPGVSMVAPVRCPSCGHRWEAPIRLRAEFFRPKIRGRKHS